MPAPDELLQCTGSLGIKVTQRRIERFIATLEQTPGKSTESFKPGMLDGLLMNTPEQVAHCTADKTVQEFINNDHLGAKVSCIFPVQPAPPNRHPATELEGTPTQRVIDFIRKSVDRFLIPSLQSCADNKHTITLQRPIALKYFINEETGLPDKHMKIAKIVYSWPGKDREDAKHFAQVFKILNEILICIYSKSYTTPRDLFYHDPPLFGKQEVVNRIVKDLAFTCGVNRKELHVHAGTKGLISGSWHTAQNKSESDITKVPYVPDRFFWSLHGPKWMMVVEKEATLKALHEQKFHEKCILGLGLLVSGKGYPDEATRAFINDVSRYWGKHCSPCRIKPIFGLVDCDPDGLNIFKIYLRGSGLFGDLYHAIPSMQFLGVCLSEVLPHMQTDDVLLPLTKRDRKMATNLLLKAEQGAVDYPPARTFTDLELSNFIIPFGGSAEPGKKATRVELEAEYFKFTHGAVEFRKIFERELRLMLMTGMKMEIQCMEDRPGGLVGYLNSKMQKWLAEPPRVI